jgi:hypothetical protein
MENPLLDSHLVPSSFRLMDNSGRARAALVVGTIFLVVTLASIAATVNEYILLSNYANGSVAMKDLENSDTLQQLVNVLNLIVYITFIVVFIMWFRRAYCNLSDMGVNTQFSEGWAAGAWFVPFVNLGRPFTIMREIWEQYAQKANAPEAGGSIANLWMWWLSFLIGGVMGNIASRMRWDGSGISTFMASDRLMISSDILHAGSLVILLIVIKKVSGWESSLRTA